MTASVEVSQRSGATAAHGGRSLGAPPLFVLPETYDPSRDSRARSGKARKYLRPYLRMLRVTDALLVATALVVSVLLRFGTQTTSLNTPTFQIDYSLVAVLLGIGWLISLRLQGAYDGRLVGHGVQEYGQVFRASTWLFAGVAIAALALKLDFARLFILTVFPLGTALLLLGRWTARRWLVRQRRQGMLSDRVLMVGDREHVASLIIALRRTPDAGYNVLGACVDQSRAGKVAGVPVVGTEADVLVKAFELDVDVVAVSSSAGLGSTGLRRLGWALEGTDIDLVVAPGIMDVAGPRVLTRPVQGLPLIHVEAPTFGGPQLVLKDIADRVMALLGLIVLAPVLLGVAVAVKLEDSGPVIYRQERVGRDGRTFKMLKFRSMVVDADTQLPSLLDASDGAGPLFKLRQDPRVTRVGQVIRRYSLDELPQLVNVLLGDMSLVGPRPPLPREVAEYEADARRRLLVRPGMTGLWQISGRSDLSWEESVRLDLYYVENWTPVLDLMILWRTVDVVLHPGRSGAY